MPLAVLGYADLERGGLEGAISPLPLTDDAEMGVTRAMETASSIAHSLAFVNRDHESHEGESFSHHRGHEVLFEFPGVPISSSAPDVSRETPTAEGRPAPRNLDLRGFGKPRRSNLHEGLEGPQKGSSRGVTSRSGRRRCPQRPGTSGAGCTAKTGPSLQTRRPSWAHDPQTPMPHRM